MALPNWARRKTLAVGGLHRATVEGDAGWGMMARLERPVRLDGKFDYSLAWDVAVGAESVGGLVVDADAGLALGTARAR